MKKIELSPAIDVSYNRKADLVQIKIQYPLEDAFELDLPVPVSTWLASAIRLELAKAPSNKPAKAAKMKEAK